MKGSGRLAEVAATVAGRAGLPRGGAAVVGGRMDVVGAVLEATPPVVEVEPAPEPADEHAATASAAAPRATERDRRSRHRAGERWPAVGRWWHAGAEVVTTGVKIARIAAPVGAGTCPTSNGGVAL
jgi:hypothetical protein